MRIYKRLTFVVLGVMFAFISLFSTIVNPIVLNNISKSLCSKTVSAATFPKISNILKT